MNFDIEKHRIFECITGSRLYGTETPESDIDYRGVCIPPLNVLLDPFNNFDQKDSGFKEEDRTIYNLKKFMKLCADNNPNIIELLFIPKDKMLVCTKEWEYILTHKNLFISKKSKFTFSGYAFSQLKLIERHRKWFLNPPKNKPDRKDFGLPHNPIVSLAWIKAVKDTLSFDLLKDEYKEQIEKEKSYIASKTAWDNYLMWDKNRNPKRKPLEEKFGYDTKHASHLVRLMTEGEELLTTGKITFPLVNAEEILSIKNGKYSYDEIIEMADNFDKKFNELYNTSQLPHSANKKALTQVYFDVIDSLKG